MQLADLIDLEARIAADAALTDDELRARDGAIAAGLGPEATAGGRDALLTAWVHALREADAPGPALGSRLVGAWRLLAVALVLVGALAGWSVASAALAYDGRAPVNVTTYLAIFVALQLLLLTLLAGAALVGAVTRADGLPVYRDVRAVLARVAAWLARKIAGLGDRGHAQVRVDAWRAAFHRFRSRASLYGGVERALVFGLMQAFGVAFNVAAIAATLQLVATTDLAFGWSTTLALDATTAHALVDALATPWAWLAPDAVPSAAVVEGTRWFRLEALWRPGSGAPTPDPALLGAWWPFLVASTVCYGLIPRVVLAVSAAWARRRALRRLPLDTADVERVVRRLEAPRLAITAARVEGPLPDEARTDLAQVSRAAGAAQPPVRVVLWRDVPRDDSRLAFALSRALGRTPGDVMVAGGLDFEADRAVSARLAEASGGADDGADDRTDDGVAAVVVAEAWEAPDKAALRLLRDIREAVGAQRLVLVALVSPRPDGVWARPEEGDVAIWRERLATLGDPWLGVELLEEGS